MTYHPYNDDISYGYLTVPKVYSQHIYDFFRKYIDGIRDESADVFLSDEEKYQFVEMPLNLDHCNEVAAYLYEWKIPFKLDRTYTDDYVITEVNLMNNDSSSKVIRIHSTDLLIYPIKGRLMEFHEVVKKNGRLLIPDIEFIHNVLDQQEAIFKLTDSLESIAEIELNLKEKYYEHHSYLTSR